MNWVIRFLCWFENKRLGALKESNLLGGLIFGAANKAFEADNPNANGFEWLSRDEAEVQKYMDDEYCGFVPFPASLGEIFAGVGTSQDKHQIHNDLKNINRLLNAWRNRGLTTTTKFYADGRHEMLNEINKEDVIENLIAWLENLSFRR